jgi:hypothetical protein
MILAIGAIVIWLAAVPIRIIGSQCVREYRLDKEGTRTSAVVTALEPNNHQSVHYSYRIDTTTLNGFGRAGFGNPEFHQLRIGQQVVAVYLPSEPRVSCLGSPRQLLTNDVIPISLFLLIVVAIISYQWTKHLKGLTNRSSREESRK